MAAVSRPNGVSGARPSAARCDRSRAGRPPGPAARAGRRQPAGLAAMTDGTSVIRQAWATLGRIRQQGQVVAVGGRHQGGVGFGGGNRHPRPAGPVGRQPDHSAGVRRGVQSPGGEVPARFRADVVQAVGLVGIAARLARCVHLGRPGRLEGARGADRPTLGVAGEDAADDQPLADRAATRERGRGVGPGRQGRGRPR